VQLIFNLLSKNSNKIAIVFLFLAEHLTLSHPQNRVELKISFLKEQTM